MIKEKERLEKIIKGHALEDTLRFIGEQIIYGLEMKDYRLVQCNSYYFQQLYKFKTWSFGYT